MYSYFDFNASTLSKIGPLSMFERKIDRERDIDEKLLLQEPNNCFSVYMYCSNLERLINQFNTNTHFRSDLVRFIESDRHQFIKKLAAVWSADEYLSSVINYIEKIKKELNIEPVDHLNRTRHMVLINTINKALEEVNYDYNLLRPTQGWAAGSKSYGMVLVNNYEVVILINNIAKFLEESLRPGAILFFTVPIRLHLKG
ncbi:TPA: hypothetical protein ACNV5N_005042 [Citrobacter freundii]